MIKLYGRVLPRPTLSYQQKRSVSGRSWNLDKVLFRKPMGLIKWACLRIIENPRYDWSIDAGPCREQLNEFVSHLRLKGITVDDSHKHGDLEIKNREDFLKLDRWFNDCLQGYDVTFLIVLLPDRRTSELYNHIKRYGDVKYGIHTVCVTSKNLGSAPYDDNVALVSAATFLF